MLTVHKYTLPSTDTLHHIPQGGKIVFAGMQGETPCLWVLVDTAQPKELRRFMIAGTGHELPQDCKLEHRGTVLVHDATLVLHIFENVDYVTAQRRGEPN